MNTNYEHLGKKGARNSTRPINVNDLIKKTREGRKKEGRKTVLLVAGSISVLAITGFVIAS